MVVRYDQRAPLDRERERKRTDMEIRLDGKTVAVVPNTLNIKQQTPGVKYEPYAVREAAETQEQQICGPREEQKS